MEQQLLVLNCYYIYIIIRENQNKGRHNIEDILDIQSDDEIDIVAYKCNKNLRNNFPSICDIPRRCMVVSPLR